MSQETPRSKTRFTSAIVATALLIASGEAAAALFYYQGLVSLCTGACDSVAALETGAFLEGYITIDVEPNDTFGFVDVDAAGHDFEFLASFVPLVPFDGANWMTANPLPLTPDTAILRASGGGLTTEGTTGPAGEFTSGNLLYELVGPFDNNDAWFIFDLATGNARICLFFTTAGCIPGATEIVGIAGLEFVNLIDSDSDGWLDFQDNCVEASNGSQIDTDEDGFGNICDPDLNNDCSVNFADLNIVKQVFFSDDEDADLNSDGIVNFGDLNLVKAKFFGAPGPSYIPNVCAPEIIAAQTFGDGGTPTSGSWSTGVGDVVDGAGEGGRGDHALMYTADSPQANNGFNVLHPVAGGTPNPAFLGNYLIKDASDVEFRARHSGVGDSVVLRVVLFEFAGGVDWAQTTAAVTIPNTATEWQTYQLSIRESDLVKGGANGLTFGQILSSVDQISLRHDPLGTGPLTQSPVARPTTVFFDDITLSAQAGHF